MPVETEVKISVSSFKKVKERLVKVKARNISTVHEKNVIYDTSAGNLREEGVGLRLRCEEDRAKGSIRAIIVTLKGPKMRSIVKERLEFEVRVSSFRKVHEILCALGFRKALIYEKMREKWMIGKTEICLDTLPFGKYVEIEGDMESISGTAGKLGFSERQFVTSNYFELAGEKGVEGDILFDSD